MNGNTEMKLEQALVIVASACAEFKGTLQDHKTIQLALQTVEKALQAPALVADGEKDKG